ncbi:MAG: transposase [Acidithiobacillus sp.]
MAESSPPNHRRQGTIPQRLRSARYGVQSTTKSISDGLLPDSTSRPKPISARDVVLAYSHRWQIEPIFHNLKRW